MSVMLVPRKSKTCHLGKEGLHLDHLLFWRQVAWFVFVARDFIVVILIESD
jgi:hypothetical protein